MSLTESSENLITVIDYDAGNILNVLRALKHIGYNAVLASSPEEISTQTQLLIIPGVGAFGQGMKNLNERGFVSYLNNWQSQNKPLIGICLGMQLLFSESSELGQHKGLSYLQGHMQKIPLQIKGDKKYTVPHIGWSEVLDSENKSEGLFYFVHSYYATETSPEQVLAQTLYGDIKIPAIVAQDNTIGFQFHPEKSSESGLKLLKNTIASLLK